MMKKLKTINESNCRCASLKKEMIVLFQSAQRRFAAQTHCFFCHISNKRSHEIVPTCMISFA